MKNLFEKMVDRFRKRRIFELAMKSGINVDGDIICYKGQKYFIHIFYDELVRIKE